MQTRAKIICLLIVLTILADPNISKPYFFKLSNFQEVVQEASQNFVK